MLMIPTISPSAARLRVLHVTPPFHNKQAEEWIAGITRHMNSKRFQFDFTRTPGHETAYDAELVSRGSRLIPLPSAHQRAAFLRALRRAMIDNGPYDIVHAHAFAFSGLVQLQAMRAGISVRITQAHGDRRKDQRDAKLRGTLYGWLMRRLIQSCSTAGLVSDIVSASALFGQYWWFKGKWQMMPPGIDAEIFAQPLDQTLRQSFGLTAQTKIIGHVGSFHIERNHDLLISIFERLARHEPAAVLLLIGDGPMRPAIEQRVRASKISPRVIFAGERDDIAECLKIMDLFMYPSLHETSGQRFIEAQAAGLPCLISDAVPEDMDVVKGSIMRLALEEGIDPWVEKARLLLKAPRPHAGLALETIKASEYTLASNADHLAHLYERLYAERLGA